MMLSLALLCQGEGEHLGGGLEVAGEAPSRRLVWAGRRLRSPMMEPCLVLHEVQSLASDHPCARVSNRDGQQQRENRRIQLQSAESASVCSCCLVLVLNRLFFISTNASVI